MDIFIFTLSLLLYINDINACFVFSKTLQEMAERSAHSSCDKPVHLVMLGRPGAGKTALRNTILYGNSKGHPGPNPGTPEFDNSPDAVNTINGVQYIVRDTPGIDVSSDTSFIKDEIDTNLLNQRCIVVLCIKWSDRILDADRKVLELVNSFSNDIWNKVIIALTHSDLSPNGIEERNENEFNAEWHEAIKENIRQLDVSDDTLKQLNICNTSKLDKDCFFKDWLETLIMKLAEVLSVKVSEYIVSSFEKCISGGVVSAFGGISIGTLLVKCGITASLGDILGFVGYAAGGAVLGIIVVAAYIKFHQERKEKEK